MSRYFRHALHKHWVSKVYENGQFVRVDSDGSIHRYLDLDAGHLARAAGYVEDGSWLEQTASQFQNWCHSFGVTTVPDINDGDVAVTYGDHW
jgi:hypothetical protein